MSPNNQKKKKNTNSIGCRKKKWKNKKVFIICYDLFFIYSSLPFFPTKKKKKIAKIGDKTGNKNE